MGLVEKYNDLESDPMHWPNRKPPAESCTHGSDNACINCNPDYWNGPAELHKAYSSKFLGTKILKAKKAYYEDGTSTLTDQEYDALETSLKAIDPDNPIFKMVGMTYEKPKRKRGRS